MTEFDPACRRCPRLAAFLDEGRARHPRLPLRPGGAVRRRAAAAAGRGARAGLPRRERHRPAVHRRLRGRAALRDAARLRLGERAGLVVARRRPRSSRAAASPTPLSASRRATSRTPAEIATCNAFLREELDGLAAGAVVLALGAIAHGAVLRARGLRQAAFRFAHGAEHALPGGRALVDSYHCSRYNTNTRRLTERCSAAVVRHGRASWRRRRLGA